jgi:calcineurin-like phosphoesterase family protein
MTIFLTSDWHLGHQNILAYEPTRPFDFEDVLWRAWEEQVRPEDTVWFLGDFCFGDRTYRDMQLARFRSLPGTKHWILGNHDRSFSVGYLERNGVHGHRGLVGDEFYGVPVLLSHYPPFAARSRQEESGTEKTWRGQVVAAWSTGEYKLCIHGHSHSKRPHRYGERGEFVNVSPEVTGFRLVDVADLVGGTT